jgi:hypothetical protein
LARQRREESERPVDALDGCHRALRSERIMSHPGWWFAVSPCVRISRYRPFPHLGKVFADLHSVEPSRSVGSHYVVPVNGDRNPDQQWSV